MVSHQSGPVHRRATRRVAQAGPRELQPGRGRGHRDRVRQDLQPDKLPRRPGLRRHARGDAVCLLHHGTGSAREQLLLANAGQFTRLTSSSQEEVGLKSEFWDKRASATLALYNIERSNILISTSEETVGTVGSQNSRGAEFETGLRITRDWTVSANATYTRSRYGTFTDPLTGSNDAGNRPPDVLTWTAAIFTRYERRGPAGRCRRRCPIRRQPGRGLHEHPPARRS